MKNLLLIALTLFSGIAPCLSTVSEDQTASESSINAIVRNKLYFKSGVEITPIIGTMPYDSIINHYGFGAHFTYHLSDHFAWEIIDGQYFTSSLSSFTTNTVTEWGISNLQVPKIKYLLSTNFIWTPIYGKLRVLGKAVLHYDVYTALGIGAAKTEITKLSSTQRLTPGRESIVQSGFDPLVDVGIGMRLYFSSFMGAIIEARDYIIYSTVYGKQSAKSHFAVYGGLTFQL